MSKFKTHLISLVLVSAMLTVFPILPIGYSAETLPSDRTLEFLTNVVGIDVSKYNVTLLGPFTDYWDWLGGLAAVSGTYSLVSEASKIEVLFTFVNGSLFSCLIDIRDGAPYCLSSMPANFTESVVSFLEKYQIFTGNADMRTLKNLLESTDISKNITNISGDLKLEVSINSLSSFKWVYTFNGADYSGLSLSFQNGTFYSIRDERSFYKIGNSSVTISQKDATEIALKKAGTFSYSVNDKVIQNFTIVQERISAGLRAGPRDSPLELYPYWIITMPLNDVYPGFVYYVEVLLWADTGEVFECHPLGYGGTISADIIPIETSTPEPDSLTSPSPQNSTFSPSVLPTFSASPQLMTSPSETLLPTISSSISSAGSGDVLNTSLLLVVGVLIVFVVIAMAIVVFRRRRG